ncbi:MAG: acylphosphatase [Sneathiella sp.]
MKSIHARIRGRVQGVGYRAWTIETATRLGLTGWVRNRLDGSVEAVFQGSDIALYKMLEKCEDGPLLARVLEIKTKDLVDEREYEDFTSKSTR